MENKDKLSYLEKADALHILITLLESKEISVYELLRNTGMSSSTFYNRKRELKELGLINIDEKPTEKNGILFGKTVYISLTPKGKKIAEKLKEIKEILEEEKK